MSHPLSRRAAAAVRAEIARAGILQKDIAAAIGMRAEPLSKRLRGRIAFNTDELGRIADVLNIPISRLIDGHDVDGDADQAAGNTGKSRVSPAPQGDAGSRERLGAPGAASPSRRRRKS